MPALAAPPRPAADTPAPAARLSPPAAPAGYFQRPGPARLIVASFFAVTLPVAALAQLATSGLFLVGYVWLFAMTHFVVTFALYFQSANLRHFRSSVRNRMLYFAMPVAVFVGFDLLHACRVSATLPAFAVWFWGAVRLLDFHHFGRQSFGVLQLMKARAGAGPRPLRRLESLHFALLTGLMFVTFLSGGVCPLLLPGGPLTLLDAGLTPGLPRVVPLAAAQAAALAGLLAVAALAGAAARGWARAAGGRDGCGLAFGYFAVQTAAGLMAVASFPLYLAALAVHYVEYHVLMVPRCFHARLDPASRVDRVYGRVRANRPLFAAVVLAAAALVTAFSVAGMGMMGRDPAVLARPFDYLVLIAVFDGLFVFHYLIEMAVWRFSNPHYRATLGPLYFAPKGA